MTARRSRVGGFTLIELLITLTIAAVLAAVAVPSVQAFLRNNELSATSSALLTSINTARIEAMKSGRNTMLVPVDNGTDWSRGWVVFVDDDRTQIYNSSTDTIIAQQGAVRSYFTVSGTGTAAETAPYVLFNPSGYAITKANAFGGLALNVVRNDLSGGDLLQQTRRVIIANTGRARTCQPASDTDANCLATASQ